MPTLTSTQLKVPAHDRIAEHRAGGSALLLQQTARSFTMKMPLRSLLKGISEVSVMPKRDPQITALAIDSRRVVPGAMFFAMSGLRTDGSLYVGEAIERGAVVIVAQNDCWVPPGVTLVQVANVRTVLAAIASRFYGDPQHHIELGGFLGTSGKTVAASLTRHLIADLGPSGMLGTISYAVGKRTLPAHRTTPEPIELYGLLAQMKASGCKRALIEVSAHGIDQGRLSGLQFSRLVLMNLTPEHLHYHGSFERYVQVHREYISRQAASGLTLIVAADDPVVMRLAGEFAASPKVRVMSFGLSEDAMIRAESVVYSKVDTRFTLVAPHGRWQCVSPLLGEFNLQNLLAAIAYGSCEGVSIDTMVTRLLPFPGVRGRMERIESGNKPAVIIDYMHTEASYEKGLKMVRALGSGRLITVFGCGGNRDPHTRPVITKLVCAHSDAAIATADNPRHEDLEAIFADMLRGNEQAGNLHFIADRRAAIEEAIRISNPEDTILIAGKGHETFQEFADCVVPFDDKVVAREILNNQRWHSS